MGVVLGVAGASFAVALPQAGRWYPPNMQGLVMGLAGAGNIGVVIDSLLAPRIAAAYGWQSVFGFALIPAVSRTGAANTARARAKRRRRPWSRSRSCSPRSSSART